MVERIRFLVEHREWFGVEFLRRVLKDAAPGFLTSRGYRAVKTRPASARHLRNKLLIAVIKRLHEENYGVYGMWKVRVLLKRKGWDIGGDQTARLMPLAGVRGVARSKMENGRADQASNTRVRVMVEQHPPPRKARIPHPGRGQGSVLR